MAQETSTTDSPAGDPQAPAGTNTDTQEPEQQGDPATQDQEIRNPTAVLSALHATRDENKELKRQVASLTAQSQEKDTTTEQRIAALEAEREEAKRTALVSSVWAEATEHGATNRKLIERLVENDATDAAAEVERIKTEYPELFQTGSGTPKPDTAGRGRGTAPDPQPFNPLASRMRR